MNPLIVEAIITAIFTYYLYSHYVSKHVNIQISLLVLLVWFLTFFSVFILPLDIYYSNFSDIKSNPLQLDVKINENIDNNSTFYTSDKKDSNLNVNNNNLNFLNQNKEIEKIQTTNQEHITDILNVIKILWNVIYWTIYVLSWLVIPIYQEYEAAGDFTFTKKLKRSLKRNAIFYFFIIVVGSGFISYLLFSQKFTM